MNAIASHTTGCPHMSLLDKIIYIADYIEPRRNKAPNLLEIRKLAYQDLDETMYQILKGTLTYLKKKGSKTDQVTVEAFEYYAWLHKERKTEIEDTEDAHKS